MNNSGLLVQIVDSSSIVALGVIGLLETQTGASQQALPFFHTAALDPSQSPAAIVLVLSAAEERVSLLRQLDSLEQFEESASIPVVTILETGRDRSLKLDEAAISNLGIAAARTGTRVFLSTQDSGSELQKGVYAAVLGQAYCSMNAFPAIIDTMIGLASGKGEDNALRSIGNELKREIDAGLTQREKEIAHLIMVEGLSNEEIANRLFIAPNTVKTHIQHLKRKLNIKSRTKIAGVLRGEIVISP